MATLTFFADWITYIVLTVIGISLAYIGFYITHDAYTLPSSLLGILGSYSAPVIYLVLFSHKRQQLYKDTLLNEEKEFNNKLLKQSADLEKALLIKNEFLNNISHEVRTPINGVVNISELLVENWSQYSEDEQHNYVALIAKSGKNLLALMNNILDLSKFESGKMTIHKSTNNLSKIIFDIVEEYNLLYLHNKQITIEFSIQSNLDCNITIDPERISQVLRNLVGNAIKFTTEGKIRLQLQKQGDYLEVTIRDEGIGIPENELEEIFKPFIQSTLTKSKAGGTGLGLAICKEIIEAHHGQIWAKNNPGNGSTFHFLLPKNDCKEDKRTFTTSKNAVKILVVDDDPTCHSILSLIFRDQSYQMVSVYGGKEALQYLKGKERVEDIHIIFLDLMMPDMYGMNVLKEIKSDDNLKNIPVVIQSASYDTNERHRSFELGSIAFIKKPYERNKINEIIKEHIKFDD